VREKGINLPVAAKKPFIAQNGESGEELDQEDRFGHFAFPLIGLDLPTQFKLLLITWRTVDVDGEQGRRWL